MKLCMLAPEFLPVWGGVGTYIVELIRHLPTDVEVHVVTPLRECLCNDRNLSSSNYDLSEYFGSNVHVHYVSTANDTFVYNAKFQYACQKYVPKLVKEEHIDVIHSHTAHMPDLLLQFKRVNVPTVTTIHTTIQGQRDGTQNSGMGFWNLEFSEKLTYLTYPFLNLAEKVYFSKKGRYYITVSNWMKDQISEQYPKIDGSSVSVIHNSVDTKMFSPKKELDLPQRNIVLFTGRLVAAKGIGYLVEAIPKILHEHPDTLFLFVGAGNSLPYSARLKERGISENNFAFLGYLKQATDLVKYYQSASIYVAPTLYENLPIRVLEAMSCGVPVVASNVCAIPEAIDNGVNGMLVQPRSVDELTESICSLLSDQNLRMTIGNNARKTALEQFDWSINTARTTAVYQQTLDHFNNKNKS